jgi:hypothetical protein
MIWGLAAVLIMVVLWNVATARESVLPVLRNLTAQLLSAAAPSPVSSGAVTLPERALPPEPVVGIASCPDCVSEPAQATRPSRGPGVRPGAGALQPVVRVVKTYRVGSDGRIYPDPVATRGVAVADEASEAGASP